MGGRPVTLKRGSRNKALSRPKQKEEATKEQDIKRDSAQSVWVLLPEHLLQQILGRLVSSEAGWIGQKALFAACGTCHAWRSAGFQCIFNTVWQGSPVISHPAQLFLMSPKPVEGGLVKCYIKREDISGGLGAPHYQFLLYLGSDHTKQDSKFLLCAVQHSWQRILLYISRTEGSFPCAKLVSNLIGTHHQLLPCRSASFLSVPDSVGIKLPDAESLAGVSYKKGMMRPRRLNVSLLHPSVSNLQLEEGLLCNSQLGRSSSDVVKQTAWKELHWALGKSTLAPAETDTERDNAQEHAEKQQTHPLEPVSTLNEETVQDKGMMLRLTNKPPQWNEGMKCWCLNFRGRVKLASVKNFQLMCSDDGAGRIVMQFGKVDTDTFIMDFNPEIMTGVQAFAVALTSFEGRLLL